MNTKTAARRPPRDILKENKENQMTQLINNRHLSLKTQKIGLLTEVNSISVSRARTPVRGRLLVNHDKSQSQKMYFLANQNNDEVQKYQSTKDGFENKFNSLPRVKTLPQKDEIRGIVPTCDSSAYQIGPIIGKGSYAIVKLGHNAESRVAIKIYDKYLLKGERLNNLLKEINTIKTLKHEQIVKLLDIYHTPTTVNLVLDFCGTESLYTLLKSAKVLHKDQALQIMYQLLKILHYVHDHNICHRDIKLENILITNKKIKLIDFGFSTFSNLPMSCHCGTPSYMAPEVTQKLKYDGRASDIWATGVLFICLLQGSFPFKGASERELFKKIRTNEYTVMTNDRDIRYLIAQIFILDPKQRATAKEVNIYINKLLQLEIFRTYTL